jgi:hypothetical protein
MSKIIRTTLINEQKLAIIKYKDENHNVSHINIVNWTKVMLLKRKGDLRGNLSAKRLKVVQYPDLENPMCEWVIQYQTHVTITDAILTEKAKRFAQLLNLSEDQFV